MPVYTSTFSFCADTEYNSTAVAKLLLASHMLLFAQFHATLTHNYIPEVPLNNMHTSYNKGLVKFCCCYVGGV